MIGQAVGWAAPFAAVEIRINWTIFGLALGLMAAGLALFFWGVRRRNVPYLHTTNPIVWALVAMGPALLLFSIFPDTTAEGKLGTFTLGGAFAAFALVWWQGARLGREGIDADANVDGIKAALAAARRDAAIAKPARDDPILRQQDDLRYAVRGRKGKELVILTGDLLKVHQADVWVSPENTNMQPSRYHERSISAMIRYYGAQRDADGDPLDDVVGDELSAAMRQRNKSVVPAAAVIPTAPGALAASNGVKRIYHVAAVEGSPGGGYTPVAQIGRCVTQALERMDAPDEAVHGAVTIAFPLLATGVAGGDPAKIAPELVAAAADYLKQHEGSRVQRVYLLAYRQSELHHWTNSTGASTATLKLIGGSAQELLEQL
jgi:hypothetical protein